MFALAGHLGMTVDELGDRMSSSEISEWIALLAIEPWGCYRQDLLHAIACYATTVAWTKNGKVSDWLPKWSGNQSQPQDDEQAKAYLLSLGGTLRHGNNQHDGNQGRI